MFFRVGGFTTALVVWSLLIMLWMSSFHPIAIGAVLFSTICLFFQERVLLKARGMGVLAVVALLFCFFCTRVIERDATGRLLGIGTISLAILATLLVGVALVLKKQGHYLRSPILAACAVLVLCSMSQDIVSVGLLASVGICLLVLSLREALSLRATFRLIAPLLVVATLTTALSVTASWSESKVSYLMSLFALAPPTGIRFPPATSLRSLQSWNSSDVVVLRGYGENPPLYLVGRSFNTFDTNSFWKWQTQKEVLRPEDQILIDTATGRKAVSVFERDDSPGVQPGAPFTLEFPKAGNGFTFYAPRNFHSLAAELSRLHKYADGMLQVLAKDSSDGVYYLFPYNDGWVRHDAVEPLSAEVREECLALPENLTPLVAQRAQEVAGKASDPERKADFITAYLQQNFEYGYDFPFKSNQTALEEFLSKKPPAHCEFFATSAALMLRAQGVPTRYINGFVLQERSVTGSYYVVRLKHAHAWIEVYLEGKGWVTYDPTPPGVLDDPNRKSGWAKSVLEWMSNQWRRFFNFFSLSPTEMMARVRAFFALWTWRDYVKLLGLLALWGLWRRVKKRTKKVVKKSTVESPYKAGRDEQLTPSLESLMEYLEEEEWRRQDWETPVQWLSRLKTSTLEEDIWTSVQRFVNDFNRLRYGKEFTSQEVTALREQLQDLEQSLKGKSLEARERRPYERDPQEVQA